MEYDWIMGLLGGLMIGCAGALYLLGNGRIMGASGVIGSLVDGTARSATADRLAFVAGTALIPALLTLWLGAPDNHLTNNLAALVVAGLLVGVGTRVANGCTSGHGVCGMSRLSMRGFIATVFYILAGGLTLVVFRHLLGVI